MKKCIILFLMLITVLILAVITEKKQLKQEDSTSVAVSEQDTALKK